jgi:ABC-type transport system substrate-binding protein
VKTLEELIVDDIKPVPKPSQKFTDIKPSQGPSAEPNPPSPEAATESVGLPSSEFTEDETFSTPPANPIVSSNPKSPRKKLWIIVLVLLLLSAAVGAYFFWSSNHQTANTKSSAGVVAKKDIAHIRFASNTQGWESFYPVSDTSSTYMEANMAVFEGLVRYENKTHIVPLLATSWTNPDDDNTTWVFNLKKNVTFHTGRVMTPEDVKASFEAAKDTVWGETFGPSIKSITVSGPSQITIKTDGPDPTLLKKLVNYFVYDTKSGKTGNPINGTGPFIVKKDTQPSESSLELVAYDRYHGGHVYVRSLSFIGLSNQDAGEAYNTNKADVIDEPPTKVTRAHKSLTVEPNAVFLLGLNTKRAASPLQNIKVRQALYLATDPVALAKVRQADPILAAQLIPASIPGYNPDITRPARDIAKAKELLKEAGYPNGITLNFAYYAPSQTTADEISRQLLEAGIKLKQDPLADVKTLGQKAGSGGTDIFFQSYASDILDASDVLSIFSDSANYTNQKVIDMIAQAQESFDSSKRLGLLQQASKLMSDDLGVIPMYTPKSTPITYDSSYIIQRDINSSSQLGIYWAKVYAK